MSRSSKKGPYVDAKLLKKVMAQKTQGGIDPIKTWARACAIPPEFVDHKFLVHNGKRFQEIHVSEDMVGHKLGEFALTRTWRGHTNKKEDKRRK